MPIVNQELWDKCIKNNQDPYGMCINEVAAEVMRLLDVEDEFDPHELIRRADHDTGADGITGFMAGAVAATVAGVHSRGAEFRAKWNASYNVKDDQAGVVNPAIITIKGV